MWWWMRSGGAEASGNTLLAELGAWAAGHGAQRLQLLADRDNAAGLDFYGKLGWQTTRLICLRRRADQAVR